MDEIEPGCTCIIARALTARCQSCKRPRPYTCVGCGSAVRDAGRTFRVGDVDIDLCPTCAAIPGVESQAPVVARLRAWLWKE